MVYQESPARATFLFWFNYPDYYLERKKPERQLRLKGCTMQPGSTESKRLLRKRSPRGEEAWAYT